MFGVPDVDLGEVPVAWVVRRPGAGVEEAGLLAACGGVLARCKVPRTIRFVNEFPLTVNGKVRRHRMREEMLEQLA